jgi:hypothetical protein
MDADDVVALENLLRAQWLRLRDWIDNLDLAVDDRPSVLEGWTVAELVAHLGHGMSALTRAQPAPAGAAPITLDEHVSSYPDRADAIAEGTREIARGIATDPLPSVERMVEEAFAQVGVLRAISPDPVVIGRRGPIRLSTMLTTRLLELVVHGDDLVRSVLRTAPGDLGPLEPGAVTVVAEVLRDVLVERNGPALDVADPLTWIRLACGRVPLDRSNVPAALRPSHTGDSLPELGRYLPLL